MLVALSPMAIFPESWLIDWPYFRKFGHFTGHISGILATTLYSDHFRRRFGRFAFYYRSKRGREEIDFALFEGGTRQALFEVKQQTRIREKHRSTLSDHGGGILAVRNNDDLEWHADDNVAAVPASYLLAMLPWRLSLFPERE